MLSSPCCARGGSGGGGGRGDRGCRGGRRSANKPIARYAQSLSRYIFIGGSAGRLLPYSGPFEDPRLQSYSTYQLCSAAVSSGFEHQGVRLVSAELLESLSEVLQPGVRWKSQFGTHVVYFGHRFGLAMHREASLTGDSVDGAALEEETIGPNRSSFVSVTFPNVAAVVGEIRKHDHIEAEERVFTLRATENGKYGGPSLFYERSGASYDEILDEAPFTAGAFKDERRCANLIFAPPRTVEEEYFLFRLQGSMPTESVPRSRSMQVLQSESGPTVRFLDDATPANYVRAEERHVLKIKGTATEIHVVSVAAEYGHSVGLKANPIRVQLQGVCPQGSETERREAFELFTQRSLLLRNHLLQLENRTAVSEHSIEVSQVFCMADSAVAPCSYPFCQLKHRFTVCLQDAQVYCEDKTCRFWHGFSEVNSMLQTSFSNIRLVRGSLHASRLPPKLRGQLRVALSLQLLRLRDAASAERRAKKVLVSAKLAELAKQYNTICQSIGSDKAKDVAFFDDAAKLRTMVSLALFASSPKGFYQCPLCSFFTRSCDFFAKRRMFLHGPLPLDTRTPVEKVRIVEKLECPVCKRLTTVTQMKRHVEAAHDRLMDRKIAGGGVTATPTAAGDIASLTTVPRVQVCPSSWPLPENHPPSRRKNF